MQRLEDSMITRARNTKDNMDFYDNLVEFFDGDDSSSLLKMRSFSLYSPRQVQSDYLVRYELFKKILDVHGSVAEFGVFNGQGLMSFANFSSILEPNNLNRKIYGFDTFEGFAGVEEKDSKTSDNEHLADGGYLCRSFERIRRSIELYNSNRFIGHIDKVHLIKGNVLSTFEAFIEDNPHALFAMVYFDMDIYAPTKYVLERIISRVPKNGIIAFDELSHESFPGETIAVLETLDLAKYKLLRIPFCSRISYIQL